MAYGLRVYNGSGNLQFDTSASSWQTLQLLSSSTTSCAGLNTSASGYIWASSPLISKGSGDIVFVQPASSASVFGYFATTSFRIYCSANINVRYRIYRQTSSFGQSTGYGLRIINGNSQSILNDDNQVARVWAILSGSGSVTGSNLYGALIPNIAYISSATAPDFGKVVSRVLSFSGTSSVSLSLQQTFRGHQQEPSVEPELLFWSNPSSSSIAYPIIRA